MKNNRILNGYILIYNPEHPKSMVSNNWNGYIYEHIIVAEQDIGRYLNDDEEVHHLDLDRSNNRSSNLIVLSKKSHGKLHVWIENGIFINKNLTGINNCLRCKICSKPLKLKQLYYCSNDCMLLDKKSKMDGISLDEVLNKLIYNPMYIVAKDYNISDNGLMKWLLTKHNLDKTTLKEKIKTLKKYTKVKKLETDL